MEKVRSAFLGLAAPNKELKGKPVILNISNGCRWRYLVLENLLSESYYEHNRRALTWFIGWPRKSYGLRGDGGFPLFLPARVHFPTKERSGNDAQDFVG